MVDEKMLVHPPHIPDTMDHIHLNVMFAHLLSALSPVSRSQSMAMYHINPCKHNTVHCLLTSTFPAIKSTNIMPTSLVTPKTVGYIHTLVIDAVTLHLTELPYARALRKEEVILIIVRELDKLTPSTFAQIPQNCSIAWLVTVTTRRSAIWRALMVSQSKINKRKFKAIAPVTAAEDDMEGASSEFIATRRRGYCRYCRRRRRDCRRRRRR